MTTQREVPPMYVGVVAKAPKSRTIAIKAFCLACVGYVRADITNCTATQCALHSWRPYSDHGRPKQKRKPAKVDQ